MYPNAAVTPANGKCQQYLSRDYVQNPDVKVIYCIIKYKMSVKKCETQSLISKWESLKEILCHKIARGNQTSKTFNNQQHSFHLFPLFSYYIYIIRGWMVTLCWLIIQQLFFTAMHWLVRTICWSLKNVLSCRKL